jgi:predicted MFS family arabinose efflux permease
MKFNYFSQYRGLRKEIYVLFFGRVVTNLGSMVWPMLTMILSQKMGLDATTISLVTVGSGLLMIPANLLGGRLADKRNKKRIIVIGDSVSILFYLICGLIPLSAATIVMMLLAGIFQSLEGPSYNALIADLSTTKDRDRAYSLQYLGANLGLVLSPTLSGLLFEKYLWLSFLISGFAIACSTVLIALLVRDIRPEPDDSEASVYQASQEKTPLLQILRHTPILLLFLIATAIYYAAYGQYTFLLPLEMGRVHGETGALIFGTVSSLNCIVVVFFTPLITRLAARLKEPEKLLIGQGLLAVGYLLFLLLMGKIPTYYVAMLLFTWGEIFSTLAEGPYLSRRIPASHRGRLGGFSTVLQFVIQGACELGVGKLYDVAGSAVTWIAVLGLLAASAALTVILALRDRRVFPKLYEKGAALQATDNS